MCVEHDIAYAVTRRDACKSVVLIPLRLCGLDAAVQTALIKIPRDTEGLLLHCAVGIAVCWYMRRGKDIHLAYEVVSCEVSRDDISTRDMDLCITLLTEGITGARELDSKWYIREAHECYNLLRIAWPREDAIKKLGKDHLGIR